MTKDKLVELIKKNGAYNSNKEAERALRAVLNSILEGVIKEKSVTIVGFGTFMATVQKGRSGKIPGTDKEYITEDKYIPRFKPGKIFKELVAKLDIKEE